MTEGGTGPEPTGVFLSAVSSEFGEARRKVANSLQAKGMDVRVQRAFRQEASSSTTLAKLHDYIVDCSAVICVIGKRSGSLPPPKAAAAYTDMLIPGFDKLSYTQWELAFALHHSKRLHIFNALPGYQPDQAEPTGEDYTELQESFAHWLFEVEGFDRSSFSTSDGLRADVLELDWVPPVVRGAQHSAEETPDGHRAREARRPVVTRRTTPPVSHLSANELPFRFRERDSAKLEAALQAGKRLISVNGPGGVGKKALLRSLTHDEHFGSRPDRNIDFRDRFEDGVAVTIDPDDQNQAEDIRTAVWKQFYETDPSAVLPEQRAQHLNVIKALLFLPDTKLPGEAMGRLREDIAESAFCVTSTNPVPDAQPVTLAGFTDGEQIAALFEDRYQFEVPLTDRADLSRLIVSRGGTPGIIDYLGKQAFDEAFYLPGDSGEHPLTGWLQGVIADSGADANASASLMPDEDVATVVQIADAVGEAVPQSILADQTSEEAVRNTADSDATRAASPRYRVNAALATHETDDSVMADVMKSTVSWADYASASEAFGNRAFVIRMMDWGLEQGRYDDVIELGEATESAMALGGRHGAWEDVLIKTAEAARTAKPPHPEAEARAIHQLGSRALLRGELGKARALLYEALQRRPKSAAHARQITRQNMRLLPGAVLTLLGLLAWVAVGLVFVGAVAATAAMYDAEPGADFASVHAPAGELTIVESGRLQAITPDGSDGEFEVQIDDTASRFANAFCLTDGAACVDRESGPATVPGRGGGCDLQISDDSVVSALVPSGGSCHLWLGFQPAIPVDYEADIELSAGPDSQSVAGTLRGSGTSPISEITPDAVEFSSPEQVATFRVTNVGNAPFTVEGLGPIPDGFALVDDGCSREELSTDDSCVVSVRSTGSVGGGLLPLTLDSDTGDVAGDREALLVNRG